MHTPNTAPRTRGLIKAAAFTAAQINHTSIGGFKITPAEAKTMLDILTRHDGSTLTPERDHQGRAEISALFDKLRFNLGAMADKEVVS
jgi:hypothetical protein